MSLTKYNEQPWCLDAQDTIDNVLGFDNEFTVNGITLY